MQGTLTDKQVTREPNTQKAVSPCKAALEFRLNKSLEIKFPGGRHHIILIASVPSPFGAIWWGPNIIFGHQFKKMES